ncbi:hypothetical protein D1007_07028 [Hordeum vulgare]|nr:hypothetical protein D1007_07028 [Hordeum vulgare]
MVEATRSWDLDRLCANFIPMDVEAIQCIPISHMQEPDFWAWHFKKHEQFSVRSAYRVIMEKKRNHEAWIDKVPQTSNREEEQAGGKEALGCAIAAETEDVCLETCKVVHSYGRDAQIRNRQFKKTVGRTPVPLVCWTPPAMGIAKIHADGGLSKDRQVGAAAAACRNDQGIYQGASAVVQAGMTDPEALEAQAICEAMALAVDLQFSRVLIISDCLSIIKNINSGNRMTAYGPILKKVDRRKDSF